MSSKHAAARGTRELVVLLLNFIESHSCVSREHILSQHFPSEYQKNLSRKLWEVERYRYIKKTKKGYMLSARGKRWLSEVDIWRMKIPTPEKWDKKWRVVLFDIPTNKKRQRDTFRLRLKELGLVLYQNSVWVYPHPLTETVSKTAEYYNLNPYISYITTDTLSGEKELQRRFRLI